MHPADDIEFTQPRVIELPSIPKLPFSRGEFTEPGKLRNEAVKKEADDDEEDSENEYRNPSRLQLAMINIGLCLCVFIGSLDIVILGSLSPPILWRVLTLNKQPPSQR